MKNHRTATGLGILAIGVGLAWAGSTVSGCLDVDQCALCESNGDASGTMSTGATGGTGTTTSTTGTGGTAGMGGTGGTGGTGGMPTCTGTDTANCPLAGDCQMFVCEMNMCSLQLLKEGAGCKDETGKCDTSGTCLINQGKNCSGTDVCASGHCVDGVCCDEACDGTCRSCSVPGDVGNCINIPVNQDLDGECNGSEVCNGDGECVSPLGETCTEAVTPCINELCKDGVCCNEACTGTCRSCTVPGSVGTCINVPGGEDPDEECTSVGGTANEAAVCNGSGACKLPDGESCGNNTHCLHGHCTDDVCCNEECAGPCRECKESATGQPDGTCANVPDGMISCGGGKLCVNGACPP